MSRRGLKRFVLGLLIVIVVAVSVVLVWNVLGSVWTREPVVEDQNFTWDVTPPQIVVEGGVIRVNNFSLPVRVDNYTLTPERWAGIYVEPGFDLGMGEKPPAEIMVVASRVILPNPGIDPTLVEYLERNKGLERVHILVLFSDPGFPQAEWDELSDLGFRVSEWIEDYYGICSVPADISSLEKIVAHPRVKWIGVIQPEDKIEAHILEDKIGEWAYNEDGSLKLRVDLYGDASFEVIKAWLEKEKTYIEAEYPSENVFYIHMYEKQIYELAENDGIDWISLYGMPKLPELDDSRPLIEADTVQGQEYGLSGNGERVLVYEGKGGIVNESAHNDFIGRVNIIDLIGTHKTTDHATKVAGIVGGAGAVNPDYTGIAPGVQIISDDTEVFDSDDRIEYLNAITNHNVRAITNSWGGSCVGYEGHYTKYSAMLDNITLGVWSAPTSIVFSAGNNRDDGTCGLDPAHPDKNYGSLNTPKAAKNIITVGGVNSNDESPYSASNWGPTADGRLKPDIVAPACQNLGDRGITSTIPGNNYGVACGTSYAAPHVAGTIALMLEQFRKLDPAYEPLPSTVKAILLHTAKHLPGGWFAADGPNFKFGYGRVDARDAVDKVREDSMHEVIIEDSIVADSIKHESETDTYRMTVQDPSDIKVTLVWDDEAGNPRNQTLPKLVNNLDLVLIDPNGNTHHPWVLNPVNPDEDATRGIDNRNNVEQVEPDDYMQGIWTVRVTGSARAPPQKYSLVLSHPLAKPGAPHDLSILTVTLSNPVPMSGERVYLTPMISEGSDPQQENPLTEFKIRLYVNDIPSGEATGTVVAGDTTILYNLFSWNAPVIYEPTNYTIRVEVETIGGKTDLDDNSYTKIVTVHPKSTTNIGVSTFIDPAYTSPGNKITVYGWVKYDQGGIVPNAAISLKILPNSNVRQTITNSDGYYEYELTVPQIQSTYTLNVTATSGSFTAWHARDFIVKSEAKSPEWTHNTGINNIQMVDISTDGAYITSSQCYIENNQLRSKLYMFSTGSSTPLWTYSTTGCLGRIAISPDGEHVIAGDSDNSGTNKVYLFSRDSQSPIWSYDAGAKIGSVDISSSSKNYAIVGTSGNKVYLFSGGSSWDSGDSTPHKTYTTSDDVFTVAMTPSGDYFSAGTRDSNVYLFSKNSDSPLQTYPADHIVWRVDISDSGEYVVAGTGGSSMSDSYGKIYLFFRMSSTPIWSYSTNYQSRATISGDGMFIGGSASYMTYNSYESSSSLESQSVSEPSNTEEYGPVYFDDNCNVYYSSIEGTLTLLGNCDSPRLTISRDASGDYVAIVSEESEEGIVSEESEEGTLSTSGVISASGRIYSFVATKDNVVGWSSSDGTPLWYFEVPYPAFATVSKKGQHIVASGGYRTDYERDGELYFFYKDSGVPLWGYDPGTGVLGGSAISSNGKDIVAGDMTGRVYYFHDNMLAALPITNVYDSESKISGSVVLSGMPWLGQFVSDMSGMRLRFKVTSPSNKSLSFKLSEPDGAIAANSSDRTELALGVDALSTPGNWSMIVNTESVEPVPFTLTIEQNPEVHVDVYTENTINFSNINIEYISTCGDDGDLTFVLSADDKPGAGGNATAEAERFMKYFKQGLTVPSAKHWVNIRQGGVDIASPWGETDASRVMVEADVKAKKSDAELQCEIVQEYGRKYGFNKFSTGLSYKTSVLPPETVEIKTDGCSLYIGKPEFDVLVTLLGNKLDPNRFGWVVPFGDMLQAHRSTVKSIVNSNSDYDELRLLFKALAYAQWYKLQNDANLPLKYLVDTENLTGLTAEERFEDDYWVQHAFGPICDAEFWGGHTRYSLSILGSIGFSYLPMNKLDDLDSATKAFYEEVIKAGEIKDGDTYYASGKMRLPGPDIAPISLSFSDIEPETGDTVNISAIVSNVGSEQSQQEFYVSFYDVQKRADGRSTLVEIGKVLIQGGLNPRDTREVSVQWDVGKKPGPHQIYAEVDTARKLDEITVKNNLWKEEIDVITRYPVAVIESPTSGEVLKFGYPLGLLGHGIDHKDGWLSDNIDWSVDGEPAGSGTYVQAFNLTEGVHMISLTVTDSDSLQDSNKILVSVLPPEYPTVSVKAPRDGSVFVEGEEIYFEAEATDAEDGELDSSSLVWESDITGKLAEGSSFSTKTLQAGEHDITFTATDSSGLESAITRTITVEEGTPNANIYPLNSSLFLISENDIPYGTEITLKGDVFDPQDDYLSESRLVWESSIDSVLGIGKEITVSNLSSGRHNITLSGIDSHGQRAEASIILLVYEPIKPVVSIISPAQGKEILHGNNVTFSGFAINSDKTRLPGRSLAWYSNKEGLLGIGSKLIIQKISVGEHIITLAAESLPGVNGTAQVRMTVLDKPPEAQILSPEDSSIIAQQRGISLFGYGNDFEDGQIDAADKLTWYSDKDGLIASGHSATAQNLQAGTHKITLEVTDTAGQTANSTVSVIITAPYQKLINEFADGTKTKNLTFAGAGSEQTTHLGISKEATDIRTASVQATGKCNGLCPGELFSDALDNASNIDIITSGALLSGSEILLNDTTYAFDGSDLFTVFDQDDRTVGEISTISEQDGVVSVVTSEGHAATYLFRDKQSPLTSDFIYRFKYKPVTIGPNNEICEQSAYIQTNNQLNEQHILAVNLQSWPGAPDNDKVWMIEQLHQQLENGVPVSGESLKWHLNAWFNENVHTGIHFNLGDWYTLEFKKENDYYSTSIKDSAGNVVVTPNAIHSNNFGGGGSTAYLTILTQCSNASVQVDDFYAGYSKNANVVSSAIVSPDLITKAVLSATYEADSVNPDGENQLQALEENEPQGYDYANELTPAETAPENLSNEDDLIEQGEPAVNNDPATQTSLTFYMSADNGDHWTKCSLGEECILSPGTQLKWKAELSAISTIKTPKIKDILLSYSGSGPTNPAMDVGNDGSDEWTYSGELKTKETTTDFAGQLQDYLHNQCDSWLCSVPLKFVSASLGLLELSNVDVQYNYNDQTPPTINSVAFALPGSENKFYVDEEAVEQNTFEVSENTTTFYLDIPAGAYIEGASLELAGSYEVLDTGYSVDQQNGAGLLFDNTESTGVTVYYGSHSYEGVFTVPENSIYFSHLVYLHGGGDGGILGAVWLYNRNTDKWVSVGSASAPRSAGANLFISNVSIANDFLDDHNNLRTKYTTTRWDKDGQGATIGQLAQRSYYGVEEYPSNPTLSVDGNMVWLRTGAFKDADSEVLSSDALKNAVQDYVSACQVGESCRVPIQLESQTDGNITVRNLQVSYKYGAEELPASALELLVSNVASSPVALPASESNFYVQNEVYSEKKFELTPDSTATAYLDIPAGANIENLSLELSGSYEVPETGYSLDAQEGPGALFDNNELTGEHVYYGSRSYEGVFTVPENSIYFSHLVYLHGGGDGGILGAVWLYNRNTDKWVSVGSASAPRSTGANLFISNVSIANDFLDDYNNLRIKYTTTRWDKDGIATIGALNQRSSYDVEKYPQDVSLSVDNNVVWTHDNHFKDVNSQVLNSDALKNAVQDYVSSCQKGESCRVPLTLGSATEGSVTLKNLDVSYNYTVSSQEIIVTSEDNQGTSLVKSSVNNVQTEFSKFGPSLFIGSFSVPAIGPYESDTYDLEIIALDSSEISATYTKPVIVTSETRKLFTTKDTALQLKEEIGEGNEVSVDAKVASSTGSEETVVVYLKADREIVAENTVLVSADGTESMALSWNATYGNHTLSIETDREDDPIIFDVSVDDKTPPEISDLKLLTISSDDGLMVSDELNLTSLAADSAGTFAVTASVEDNAGSADVSVMIGDTEIELDHGYSAQDSGGQLLVASDEGDDALPSVNLRTGEYPVTITATDSSGLVTTKQVTIFYEGDDPDLVTEADEVSYTTTDSAAGSEVFVSAIVRNRGGTDINDFTIQLSLDNVSLGEKTISLPAKTENAVEFVFDADYGEHEVVINVDPSNTIDEAVEDNNVARKVIAVQDKTSPIIENIILAPDLIHPEEQVSISVAVSDNVEIGSVKASLGGAEAFLQYSNGIYSGSITAPEEGEQYLEISASDASGLSTKRQMLVTVHSSDPELRIEKKDVSFAPKLLSEGPATVSVTVHNDGASGTETEGKLLVDGDVIDSKMVSVPASSSTGVAFEWGAEEGSYELRIDLGSVSYEEKVEVLPVIIPDAPVLSAKLPLLLGRDTDRIVYWEDSYGSDTYEYKVDDSEWVNTGGDNSVRIEFDAEGSHVVQVRGVSERETSGESFSIDVVIDYTPPSPPLAFTTFENKWVAEAEAAFAWTASADSGSGISRYIVSIDGGNEIDIGSNTSYITMLESGVHTFAVKAVDFFEHESDWSEEVIIKIDTVKPKPPVLISQSHPEESKPYSDNIAEFEWSAAEDESGIMGYYYVLDGLLGTVPDKRSFWEVGTSLSFDSIENGFDTNETGLPDGTWYFHIVAVDKVGNIGTDAVHYKIQIDATPPELNITSPENTTYNVTELVLEYDASEELDACTYSLNGGESINSSSGIALTADEGQNTLVLHCTDKPGNIGSTAVEFFVDLNYPPLLEDILDLIINEDESISITPVATDSDGDELNISVWGVDFTNENGTWSFESSYEDSGTYNILASASDGEYTVYKNFTLAVLNVNRPPILALLENVTVKETGQVVIIPNASDPDNENSVDNDDTPLTYAVESTVPLVEDNNVWTWKPGFENAGNYDAIVTVFDGEHEDSQTIILSVGNVNRPPVLAPVEDITIDEGESVNIAPEVFDLDGESVTYTISEPVSDDGNWETTYEDSGTYVVTIIATDDDLSVSQDVSITVKNMNRIPVLEPIDDITISETEQVAITPTAVDLDNENSVDNDDNELTITISEPLRENGVWNTTYDDAGEYTVIVTVSDGSLSVSQDVLVTVLDVNRAPVLEELADITVDETETVLIEPSASDPDANDITYTISDPIGEDGIWKTTYEDAGEYTVTVNAKDGKGGSDEKPLTVTILDMNRPPMLVVPATITVKAGDTVDIDYEATDPDGDSLEITLVGILSLKQEFKMSMQRSTSDSTQDKEKGFHWATSPDDRGEHNFSIIASDSRGGEASKNIIVTVENNEPVIESMPDKEAFVGSEFELIIDARDIDKDTLKYSDNCDLFNIIDSGKILFTPIFSDLGEHLIIISVSDGYSDTSTEFKLVVSDNTPPSIEKLEFKSSIYTFETNNITAVISDDVNVSSAVIAFMPENNSFEMIPAEGSWYYVFVPSGTASFEFTIKAVDNYGNEIVSEPEKFSITEKPRIVEEIKTFFGGGGGSAPNPVPKKAEQKEDSKAIENDIVAEQPIELTSEKKIVEELKQDIQILELEFEKIKADLEALGVEAEEIVKAGEIVKEESSGEATKGAAEVLKKAGSLIQMARVAAEKGDIKIAKARYEEAQSYLSQAAAIRAKTSKATGFASLLFSRNWIAALIGLMLASGLIGGFYYTKHRKKK